MSANLQTKLRLKPGQHAAFVNSPKGIVDLIGSLPDGLSIEAKPGSKLDFLLLFVHNSAELTRYAPEALAAIKNDGLLWIAYPKRSSGIETDLTRDEGWFPVTSAGFRPVAQIAINETWSAVRWRPVEYNEPMDQVDAQYSGKKAALRPIYDRLLDTVMTLGDDITIQPRKSYVAFARDKQFALVAPSTMARVDLGLKMRDPAETARLQKAPGFGSGSITHKVALASPEEVDEEILAWLKSAYDGQK